MGQLSILMWIKRIRHRDLHIHSNAPYRGAIHLGNNTGKENNYGVPHHHIQCIEIVFILMTNLNNAKLKQFELHCINLDA